MNDFSLDVQKYAELVLFDDITESGALTQDPRGQKVS